jgi:hypothetical protein
VAVTSHRAQGKAASRAKHEAQRETMTERNERKDALKQAKREKSALIEFLTIKNHLRDSALLINATHAHVRMELARAQNGEPTKIPPVYWPDVARYTSDLLSDGGGLLQALVEAGQVPSGPCPACGRDGDTEFTGISQGYVDAEVVGGEEQVMIEDVDVIY